MKKLTYLLLLIFLSACNSTEPKNEKSEQNENKENKETTEVEPEIKKEYSKEFQANSWFRGTIGEAAVWLYIYAYEGKYCSAYYGYNSSKGAAIQLNRGGERVGNKVNLGYEDYTTKYTETFTLEFDPKTGSLSGEWTNSKNKKMPVKLESRNLIPQNVEEMLELLPLADNGFKIEDYHRGNVAEPKLFKLFFNSNFGQIIPNLSDFVPEYAASITDSKKLKPLLNRGIIIARKLLPGGNTLLIASASFVDDDKMEYGSAYELETQNMLCAAILDKSGKLISSVRLAGSPESSATAYLDLGFELTKDNKIRLIWDEFEMMQGRHHSGRSVDVISVGPKGFKFEGRKSEVIKEEE